MIRPNFLPHQIDVLKQMENRDRCWFCLDVGLGKTFVMTEQLLKYDNEYNLVVVQKSKVKDWIEHLEKYTNYTVIDYTKRGAKIQPGVLVINYDLIWRRSEFKDLKDFTLLLDESSKIQHENTKQSKFILKLKPKNVIMGTGSPCNGKYENLYSQIKLLGVEISKTFYWNRYIEYELIDSMRTGVRYRQINGYKNVDELITNLKKHGAVFMLSDDVLDLPAENEQIITVPITPEYKRFKKDRIVTIDGIEYVGDTSLTKMLRLRQLCSFLNKYKLDALSDLFESTDDKIIIFYNFKEDFAKISQICAKFGRKMSFVNGDGSDLTAYENDPSSVTAVQYQSGAHGLNLQKANKMIFFSLPLSCELYTQAKGRIHRLGQTRPTFYYYLICENSIEQKIHDSIRQGVDYTLALFERDD